MEHTAAIILTHNRHALLFESVAAIAPQVDVVLVVDNASSPPVQAGDFAGGKGGGVWVLQVPDQPPNLPALWNAALYALSLDLDPAYVAFLCDDTAPPTGWFSAVVDAMVATGAVAGCSDPFGHDHPPRVKTAPDGDIIGRMVGWAFVLDTRAGLEPDESMHWWFCDTDLDFQARQKGGMVMIGGFTVPNARPGEYTNTIPGLQEQAGRDRQTFSAKWGFTPW